ncbi:MAG: YihY/virulence factor BrkB family protein [Chloroflexota bacterium]
MTMIKKYALLIFNLLKDTAVNFGRDNGSMLAASLAYYTIFAIAPLLIIIVAVAGFVFGEQAVQGELVGAIEENVGREGAVLIQNLIASSSQNGANIIASIISVGLLILAASGLFGQLQKAINIVWGVTAPPDQGALGMLKSRALSFGMVIVIGFVLIISITASTILTALSGYLAEQLPVIGPLLPRFELLVSFLILIFLFALIFKILPDAEVAWRDVLVGGLVTAVLFSFGKVLIGFYLSLSDNPTYQAAGSIVILLLWIYYSSQILLFGAEFTKTYANRLGATVKSMGDEVILPQPAAVLPPQPVPVQRIVEVRDSTAVSRQSWLERAATLLIGLAVGLLVAFVSSFWTSREDATDE